MHQFANIGSFLNQTDIVVANALYSVNQKQLSYCKLALLHLSQYQFCNLYSAMAQYLLNEHQKQHIRNYNKHSKAYTGLVIKTQLKLTFSARNLKVMVKTYYHLPIPVFFVGSNSTSSVQILIVPETHTGYLTELTLPIWLLAVVSLQFTLVISCFAVVLSTALNF